MNKIFALIFAVALVFVGFFTKPAYSLPAYEVETVFFSNSSFTNVVGVRNLYCDGSKSMEGVTSSFYKRSQYPCNEGRITQMCYYIIDGVPTSVPCPPKTSF